MSGIRNDMDSALDPSSDDYMDKHEQNQAKVDFYNNKFHQPLTIMRVEIW